MAFAKRVAVREMVTGEDGTIKVIYVDPNTGQQIDNPTGYNIIEARNVSDTRFSHHDPKTREDNTPKPTVTQQVMDPTGHSGNSNISAALTPSRNEEQRRAEFGKDYYNKPGLMGLAGFLPGIMGTIGTAANLGINANNNAAVNNQRENLGFAPKSALQNVGGIISDKHGYIGDQSYNGEGNERVTPVSFEAEDKYGRTTLTPDEARMREQLNPSAYDEATQAESENAVKSYEQQYGTKGWLSGLTNTMKSYFSETPDNDSSKSSGLGGFGKDIFAGSNKNTSVDDSRTDTHSQGGFNIDPAKGGMTSNGTAPGHNTPGWESSH